MEDRWKYSVKQSDQFKYELVADPVPDLMQKHISEATAALSTAINEAEDRMILRGLSTQSLKSLLKAIEVELEVRK